MKCSEIKKRVTGLCAGEAPDSEYGFITSLNMALTHLARVLPPVSSVIFTFPYDLSRPGITRDGGAYIIDASVAVQDFLSFEKYPQDRFGCYIPDCIYAGNTAVIPDDFTGKAVIFYRRKVDAVTLDSLASDEDITVDDSLSDLFCLLAAYYLSVSEEPERAERFLSLFNYCCPLEERKRQDVFPPERVRT